MKINHKYITKYKTFLSLDDYCSLCCKTVKMLIEEGGNDIDMILSKTMQMVVLDENTSCLTEEEFITNLDNDIITCEENIIKGIIE